MRGNSPSRAGPAVLFQGYDARHFYCMYPVPLFTRVTKKAAHGMYTFSYDDNHSIKGTVKTEKPVSTG
jgi:hypothetical protein